MQRLFQKISQKKHVSILVFAIVGSYVLIHSHAATPTAVVEAESGTISSPAEGVADATASGGGAVKFAGTPAPTETVLVNTSFDNLTVTAPMLLADFKTAMADPSVGNVTSWLKNTSIVQEAGPHNKFIRQTLVGGACCSSEGIVVPTKLPSTVDEATIQYDIRFDTNFDWSLGGKLPGLGGIVPGVSGITPGTPTGCTPAGDSRLEYGWTGRGMWITPAAGFGKENPKSPVEWIGYMYNFAKKNDCGDNVRSGKSFVAGTWHTIKQRYKMNTFNADGSPKTDGVHQMWFDGTLAVDNQAVAYRTNPDLHVNYLYWEIFRGGSTAAWAGSITNTIDFDNLLITSP